MRNLHRIHPRIEGAIGVLLVLIGVVLMLVLFTSCTGVGRGNRGGSFDSRWDGKTNATKLTQSDNPAASTSQYSGDTVTKTKKIPKGTVEWKVEAKESAKPGRFDWVDAIVSGMTYSRDTEETTQTVHTNAVIIGGAHMDTSKNLAQRLAAMRPVQWVGIALLLGAAALAYFKWWTNAAIVAGAGVGMILLAAVIPGHEGAILGAMGAAAVIGCLLVLYAYFKGKDDVKEDGKIEKTEKKETIVTVEKSSSGSSEIKQEKGKPAASSSATAPSATLQLGKEVHIEGNVDVSKAEKE